MARVVRFHKTGGPAVLKIEQLDVPPPGKGEIQIRVKALGLNRAESMFRRGEYIDSARLSPSALTLIWTSPFPGGGTSSCSILRTSGPPVLWKRTTRAMAFSY